ncbi:hypothetical protein ACWCQZ_49440, partial [Streptomyces sp. NPDC002285]
PLLRGLLMQIGLALAGRAGARLAAAVGITVGTARWRQNATGGDRRLVQTSRGTQFPYGYLARSEHYRPSQVDGHATICPDLW